MSVTTTNAGIGSWRALGTISGAADIEVKSVWGDRPTKILRPEHITAHWSGTPEAGWTLDMVAIGGHLRNKNGEVGLRTQIRAWGRDRLDQAPDYARDWLATVEHDLPIPRNEHDALVQDAYNDGVEA